MARVEHADAIEKRLWKAADTLRANSPYASNEYFLPVMGLVFLRHAYSRYLAVKDTIEANLPTWGGKPRPITKQDFSQKNAIFLQPKALFDYLVALPDSEDRAKAIIEAMESIEASYNSLRGVLPKGEYQELDNEVLGQLLRRLSPDALKRVSGDVFGRIYEYFLIQFADQKAHDNGEFFTPISLVSLIAHVLEPDHGTVLDPACGSGGMFVQSARTVEEHGQNPIEKLTFRGLEKNETTTRLTKMNLAVHGLEGDIKKAITYYDDPHELVGKADYVMANPPFNVDEIDADKIKSDPRLPFGLPGVNKEGNVSNGNYVWISYFYSYLNKKGRAGFVMSSQASSAGGGEALVRRKLVESGDVDVMISIRSNFFYTRTVSCELWFLNRDKPKQHKDKVLMLDARNVYRKVTKKIYDFSPEQQLNLQAIVWLYRGEIERFLELVSSYLGQAIDEGKNTAPLLHKFSTAVTNLQDQLMPFLKTLPKNGSQTEALLAFDKAQDSFLAENKQFQTAISKAATRWNNAPDTHAALSKLTEQFAPLAEISDRLIKQADLIYKLATRPIEMLGKECHVKTSDAWNKRDIARASKTIGATREQVVDQLKQVHYFWRQAHWLTRTFPQAKLCDVAGLVKLVDRAEIAANDWSLTPGRYVGVAPEIEDENFDFAETMREIHEELDGLNTEAVTLAATIKKNFAALGI